MPPNSALERAIQHVAEAKRIVAQQRALIAHLKSKKLHTADQQEALMAFERSLAIFEEFERSLRNDKAK